MNKWDKRFIELANIIATWSKDNTKIGAILVGRNNEVISTGYNGFPYRVKDNPDRNSRPTKYLYTEHAERNAIYLAGRRGTALEGASLYLSNLSDRVNFPCADCARAIIQSGIYRIICSNPNLSNENNWKDSFEAAHNMLIEADIEITYI